ncbi:MAG TPA: tetratricopeptide repeat protein [Pyrinomonadaceae bacterium]|jgi:Tfp pilus assembly protein PilF
MQPPKVSSARSPRVFLLLSLSLLLLAFATDASAQGVGSSRGLPGSEGNNSIQGKIYFPVEPRGGRRLKVKIESTNMGMQTTVTDDDGTFRFNGLGFGPYRITIEPGEDYERTIEVVSIDKEMGGGRNLIVPITLKMKGGLEAGDDSVPKQARDLYAKSLEASKSNDHKKAAEHLEAAIALAPDYPLALNELGAQYARLGEFDKAIPVLEKAIKLAPKAFPPRLNLGFALLSKKDFPAAETQLREALKMNNASPAAHMYLGVTLVSQKKVDDAQKEFQVAIQNGKDEAAKAHYYLGGIYWAKKDYKRAADELEIYLKLSPKDPNAEKLRATVQDLRSKQ